VPTRPAQAIRPSLATSQRPTPVPRCCFHLPRAWDNGASSRVHSRSPVRSSPLPVAPGWTGSPSPLPVAPGWTGSPWASPPGFTPRRYQRRMPKWGRALGHLPGITSPASTSPPRRIHSPRGPSCRTPADPSSPIPAALAHLTQTDPLQLPDADAPQLLTCLAAVPDPRAARGRRHPLVAILGLAASAVLAGARSVAAIAEWAADAPQPVRAGLGAPPRRPRPLRRRGRGHHPPNPFPPGPRCAGRCHRRLAGRLGPGVHACWGRRAAGRSRRRQNGARRPPTRR